MACGLWPVACAFAVVVSLLFAFALLIISFESELALRHAMRWPFRSISIGAVKRMCCERNRPARLRVTLYLFVCRVFVTGPLVAGISAAVLCL